MNQIYKLVWSKVQHSELIKSHSKSSFFKHSVIAGILASVLSTGVISSVYATSYNAGGGTASGTDAIAVGDNASASEEDAIAIGVNTEANGLYSIAIGKNVVVNGENSGAIGEPSTVDGDFSYAIGNDNLVSANVRNVFILGNNVNVSNGSETAIGEGAIALGDNISISLTNKAPESRSSSSDGSPKIEHVVAIGDSTIVGEENAIAIGHAAKATALNAFAVGDEAYATAEGANAIGHSARALSSFANALGYQAQAMEEGAAAFGQSAQATVKFATAFGRETRATAESATAIGNSAKAISQSAVAIGTSAMANGGANTRAVAIGNGARVGRVDNEGTPTTGYGETIAIGGGAVVENVYGTVIGSAGSVTAQRGTAIGANASATALNSVAIGADSIANTANSVSVGSSSATRKIVNVTAGTANTDVSTIQQTGSALSLSGKTLSLVDANGHSLNSITLPTGDTYTAGDGLQLDSSNKFAIKPGTNVTVNSTGINVVGNGTLTDGNSGLISGDTLFDEVRVSQNKNYLLQANTTSQNLTALDTQIKANADAIANLVNTDTVVHYLGINTTDTTDTNYMGSGATGTNAVAFGGKAVASHTNSMALGYNSVTNADNVVSFGKDAVKSGNTIVTPEYTRKLIHVGAGTINESSTDAVNGSQLYTIQQSIDGFATDIRKNSNNISSLNASVTSALSSVAASGLLVDTMDITKADASLNNLTEGGKQIIKTYAETAVQEYMASQQNNSSAPMAPMMYSGNSNTLNITNAGNGSLHVGEGSYVNGTSSIAIGVGNQVNANNSGAFGDPSVINADESYVLGNDDTINTGATGSFIVGNDGVSDAKGGLLFGSNTKATVDAEDGIALGNQSEVSAKNAIALGSNSIADTENTLSIGSSNLKRKIVNIADGDISQNSSEAVTGAQLFLTNQKVQENADTIATKANVDASNVVVSDWATKLGVGKIEDGNSDLVTGGTVYNAIKDIGNNGLVQTNGDTLTIGANSTTSVIDVSNVDGQNRTITGVATDATDATSVANVGYVNAVGENIINATNQAFQKVDTKINKVGANAAAIANLPTPTFEGEEKWAFAAGIGHYQGETAGAVGAFYKPTDNVIARVSGSFGNGDEMVGAGVAVSLNKANTPVVSKAQLVRTINAQAEQIQQQAGQLQQQSGQIQMQAGQIQQQAGQIQQQANEIAELKAMLADLAAKVH